MDSGAGFLVYVLIKYCAYAGWCFAGLRVFRPSASLRSAASYGFLRLLIGVGFGIGVFVVGGRLHLEVPAHPYALYLFIYAPIRYVEWTILCRLLLGSDFSLVRWTQGRTQLWILGGIAVSHLADLPLILFSSEGAQGLLPVGRFLC